MSENHPAPRTALDAIPAYKPGKPPVAAPGLTPFKVSSNENPFEPLPSVLDAVDLASRDFNRYPDYFADECVERIAAYHGVDPSWVAVGPGSSGVIAQMIATLCDPGDEVIFPWRSFEAYPILTRIANAVPVAVPLAAQGRHDLDAMAAAVTSKTKLIMVCTPNNPTGTTVGNDELLAFLHKIPSHVVVVIDEAYAQFVRAQDAPDAVALCQERGNIAVTRTFSKAYGLAGLRIGYGIARPEIAAGLKKTMVPFSVTNIAQRAAMVSLDNDAELNERVEHIVAERDKVVSALTEQGWKVPDAQGNFVWLPLGEKSVEFAALCGHSAITVRPFPGEGVRVSIGESEANDRFIGLAGDYLAG